MIDGIWFHGTENFHVKGALSTFVEALRLELKRFNDNVKVIDFYPLSGNWIVVGAHTMMSSSVLPDPERFIIFNTEHFASGWCNSVTYKTILRRAPLLLDYGLNNLSKFPLLSTSVHTVIPILHESQYMETYKVPRMDDRPIDVLFCGSSNGPRMLFMHRLQLLGYRCVFGFGVYGKRLEETIDASRVGLNMSYYYPTVHEAIRFMDFHAHRVPVVDVNEGEEAALRAIAKMVECPQALVVPSHSMHEQLKAALKDWL